MNAMEIAMNEALEAAKAAPADADSQAQAINTTLENHGVGLTPIGTEADLGAKIAGEGQVELIVTFADVPTEQIVIDSLSEWRPERGETATMVTVDESPYQPEPDPIPTAPKARVSRDIVVSITESMNRARGIEGVDGVDHIHVGAGARSKLGSFLTLSTHDPIVVPGLGEFNSIEGLMYYLRSADVIYRRHSASNKMSSPHRLIPYDVRETMAVVGAALANRIQRNREVLFEFVQSTLPFRYYAVSNRSQVREAPNWGPLMAELLDHIREVQRDPFLQDPQGLTYRIESIVNSFYARGRKRA